MTDSMWSIFKDELEEAKVYKTGKGTLQFPHYRPIPAPLVRKLVRMRIKDMEAR